MSKFFTIDNISQIYVKSFISKNNSKIDENISTLFSEVKRKIPSYTLNSKSLSNNKISDSNKVKKDRKKNCSSSSKRTTILPYLTENKQVIVKSKLENEVSNLFKMLPDNYYEDPEINDHMNLLIHNIAELKQCINRNKIPFKNNRNVSSKSKK